MIELVDEYKYNEVCLNERSLFRKVDTDGKIVPLKQVPLVIVVTAFSGPPTKWESRTNALKRLGFRK